MIVDEKGDKITPKLKAQDILMSSMASAMYSLTESYHNDKMTERDISKVREQIQKQGDRVAKMFGYDKAWFD